MKRNNLWRGLLVVFIVLWSLSEINPPTGRNLFDEFQSRASGADTNFNAIVERGRALNAEMPGRTFANLMDAIGTNSIAPYFAFVNIAAEKDPTLAILHRLQRGAAGKIKLGLDLQGGSSFLVAMDTNQLAQSEERERVLAHAVEVLRKRVDRLGVAEPVIQPAGADRILIQLPGLSEEAKLTAKRQIQKAAFLEFRLVHPESGNFVSQGFSAIGYTNLVRKVKLRDGSEGLERYLVKRAPEAGLTGKHVKRAGVFLEPTTGQPTISLTFTDEGARLFADVTKANVGRLLAIVLDGELQSAPEIKSEILSGDCVIEGNFDMKEAFELANVLLNPLEAPVKIMHESSVDPTLGKDSIRSGVNAAIYGTIGVGAFMVLFYLFGGLVAIFAMLLNVVITLGVMCSIGATLTLPGIAGFVLSIGMAVDANVLIFERIREELAAGKSLPGALAAGYNRAFGTIFDSNVTTLIASVILIFMGTGPIKGFGVTLTVGVAASLFTSLVVTRLVFDFMLARRWMKSLPMLPIMRLTKFDFMRFTRPAFAISLLIIVGGLGYGVFGRGHKMLGVDFAGGDSLTLSFTQRVEMDKLRDAVARLGISEPTIQYQKPLSGGRETLHILTAFDTDRRVAEALKSAFPEAAFEEVGVDKIGPAVGREIQRSAIASALMAMFGILFYVAVRYEFSFAIAAVIATAHDALLTMGIFALAGGELSGPILAAVLTIVGYSINDKIVILDRIREDLKLGVRSSFRELINLALNQTLSRTLITGGSVMLATLSLFIFGGGVIHDFAFTFLVGVLAGTYSSIFIACPVVLWWNKGERPKTAPQVMMETAAAKARV